VAYHTVANAYRESEILSASPARLLIITFDFLLAQMTRAKVGMETRRPEITLPALDKARNALVELMASVDTAHGGELPHRLISLYSFVLAELVEMGRTPDAKRIERHHQLIQELRDAFAAAGERPASRAEVA
jgi:flagellar protein FliS